MFSNIVCASRALRDSCDVTVTDKTHVGDACKRQNVICAKCLQINCYNHVVSVLQVILPSGKPPLITEADLIYIYNHLFSYIYIV